MLKKSLYILLVLLLLISMTYILGPKSDPADLSTDIQDRNMSLASIDRQITKESLRKDIRPGNASELIWADPDSKNKTKYSVVYLHGLSSSPEEGAPLHEEFAKRYGYNMYAPRLQDHGLIAEEPLLNFTAEGFLQSAKDAIAIGKEIGGQVILIACSTGATAGIYLASDDDDIASLILIAPNIALANPASAIITMPWGKQILEKMLGGKYQIWEASDEVKKFWYTKYRYEAVIELIRLVEATMTDEVFAKIEQPVFAGYYFKNDAEQDDVISVPAIKDMLNKIKTPKTKITDKAFADAGTHVVSSPLMNPNFRSVIDQVFMYADDVLGLRPIEHIESTKDILTTLNN